MRMLSCHRLPFEFSSPSLSGHLLSKGSLSPESALLKHCNWISANNNLLCHLSSLSYLSAASSLCSRSSASCCSFSFSPSLLPRRGALPTDSVVPLRQLTTQRPAGGLEKKSGRSGGEEGGGSGGAWRKWWSVGPVHRSTYESGSKYFFCLDRQLSRSFCSASVSSSSSGFVGGKEDDEKKKKKEETENADVAVLSARVARLRQTMLSVDWSDYFVLVLNEPFWRAELVCIEAIFESLRSASGSCREALLTQTQLGELQTLMDVFYQLEDVRDHLNEVLDYLARTGGLAGTGAYSSPPLQNVQQHVDALVGKYQELKKSASATYLPQIESVLGQGLALLRQKYKFTWPDMHRYSF